MSRGQRASRRDRPCHHAGMSVIRNRLPELDRAGRAEPPIGIEQMTLFIRAGRARVRPGSPTQETAGQ